MLDNELLQIHGVDPGKKSDGIIRLIMENAIGFNSRLRGNKNLYKAKDLIDELEADILAYIKYCLNLKHKDNRNGFSQMFKGELSSFGLSTPCA